MGSNISNEVRPLFNTPAVIPTIPDWDGYPTSIISVPVKIEAKTSFGDSVVTNIDSVLNAIIAENTAGAGYRLVSIFLPYWPGRYGYNTYWRHPMEWDYDDNWFIPKYINAMCIFQKDRFFSLGKLDMYFSKVQMKLTQSDPQSGPNSRLEGGHEKIYNQLVGAGQYN